MTNQRRPKVAFVASGGAAKGIAHLGVLRALDELGIRPDVFIGASAGAVLGAFVAQGADTDDLVDWFRPFWSRQDPEALKGRYFLGLPRLAELKHPGYVASGLLSIDRFERFLRETLPSNSFRDVERTLLVTAADVDGRGRRVFGKGYDEDTPISQAVAASCCVPILFRPYPIGDRYYVDGELVRTLSLDLALESGADIVIISNVYRPYVARKEQRSLAFRGAFAVARQALNVMLSEKEKRGIDLVHQLHPHLTVLNVSADLGRFPFTDRRHARQLMTRGYREALRILAAAKQRQVFEPRANMRLVGSTH